MKKESTKTCMEFTKVEEQVRVIKYTAILLLMNGASLFILLTLMTILILSVMKLFSITHNNQITTMNKAEAYQELWAHTKGAPDKLRNYILLSWLNQTPTDFEGFGWRPSFPWAHCKEGHLFWMVVYSKVWISAEDIATKANWWGLVGFANEAPPQVAKVPRSRFWPTFAHSLVFFLLAYLATCAVILFYFWELLKHCLE
jgi:hypothetical protein